jgi:hypothetical protein
VASPNGELDAVLTREDGGGAAGGWEWYVHIVAKGNPVVRPRSHELFNAGTLTDEKIMWTQEHLLEIQYDIAEINQFTNIWVHQRFKMALTSTTNILWKFGSLRPLETSHCWHLTESLDERSNNYHLSKVPSPEKRGGLNGSMQHLPKVLS